MVKNLSTCENVRPQDAAFWKRCGEQPIDPDSNLFIGLDINNYKILVANLQAMVLRDQQWAARFAQYENLRQYYLAKQTQK